MFAPGVVTRHTAVTGTRIVTRGWGVWGSSHRGGVWTLTSVRIPGDYDKSNIEHERFKFS